MSDAVIAVRYLLANDANLLAAVPATRIKAGVLPIKTVMPAVSVTHLDTQERLTISMSEPSIIARSRIQVSAFAKTYSQCKAILELVRKALPHTRGMVGGVELDSILPENANPDFFDTDDGIHMQSRDFIVQFVETM